MRKILIDGGSSVNVILFDTLNKMDIPKSEMVRKSSTPVGFNGETKNTIKENKLPIYIEGTNLMQCFYVVDLLSCYNIILGKHWIHDMNSIHSTYHRCVKMWTPWGIIKIKNDQQEEKDCYTTSMKNSAVPKQEYQLKKKNHKMYWKQENMISKKSY